MKKICISKDWTFFSPDTGEKTQIDIPHDFLIRQPRNPQSAGGAGNGFFDGTWGSYEKYLKFGDDAHYILDIDGAYACARIYVNNNLLDMHPHGYTPYLVDLSEHVQRGIHNHINITTQNIQPSTRWYSGAGLYRDVFLWSGGKARIEPWDMFIHTLSANENCAKVQFETVIRADESLKATVEFRLSDACGNTVCSAEKPLNLKCGENKDVSVFEVKNPILWEMDNPHLYTVLAEIRANGEVLDTFETTFGVRTISADSKNGFMLNNKPLKLRGGCIHHDHGGLGSAEMKDAVHRKIKKLKEAGFNALRISHNPPSLTLLETCDREGILVMDEAFDMWNVPKNQLDYSLFFKDWWARDIKYMVLRDRNHPCVISYSIGNEIMERNGSSNGYEWSKKLADEIRKYDATKLVTSGVCGFWDSPCAPKDAPEDYKQFYKEKIFGTYSPKRDRLACLSQKYMEPLDIVGYNYMFARYESDGKLFPNRVIWGSETHSLYFYDSWNEVLRLNHVIGDFTWTAYDNLGEAGTGRSLWARDGHVHRISLAEYPWRACYQGDLDLCGFRRPQSYFREAVWIGNTEPRIFTTHPKHTGENFSGTKWHWYDVLDTWTFDDEYLGKPVKCEVYTDADEIVFELNGKEAARAKPEKAIASAYIPYEKGELKAIAIKNGVKQKQSLLRTVGEADQVVVTPEAACAENELFFFEIEIADIEKNRIPDAANEISCEVFGGELACVFSGCPNNEDDYWDNKCHAFNGRALAVVKRDPGPGRTVIVVKSNGLKCGNAEIVF